MSVLIRDMEALPEKCEDCRFLHEPHDFRLYECALIGIEVDQHISKGKEGRPERCPLVEVPQHDDLIVADALKEITESLKRIAINIAKM